jgi:hypothetical protein
MMANETASKFIPSNGHKDSDYLKFIAVFT